MLIRMTYWEKIRIFFTQQEKAELNTAIVSKSICPSGMVVDDEVLTPDLLAKLTKLLTVAKVDPASLVAMAAEAGL